MALHAKMAALQPGQLLVFTLGDLLDFHFPRTPDGATDDGPRGQLKGHRRETAMRPQRHRVAASQRGGEGTGRELARAA
jgi:hypothetical protein